MLMETSGGGFVSSIAYLVMLVVSIAAAQTVLGDLGRLFRSPRPSAVALWAMVGLLLVRRSSARVVLAAVVILVDGVVLLVLRDAHGGPILGGLILGAALAAVSPPDPTAQAAGHPGPP